MGNQSGSVFSSKFCLWEMSKSQKGSKHSDSFYMDPNIPLIIRINAQPEEQCLCFCQIRHLITTFAHLKKVKF